MADFRQSDTVNNSGTPLGNEGVAFDLRVSDLIARLEGASEGSAELDARVWCSRFGYRFHSMQPTCGNNLRYYPVTDASHTYGHQLERKEHYTRSLEAAIALVPLGWWWSAGLCGLSGHVTIGPDYNGPHRERLLREFPEDQWHEGVSVDLEPGDGIHRVCLAIVSACLRVSVTEDPQP